MARIPSDGVARNVIIQARVTDAFARATVTQARQRRQPDVSSYIRWLIEEDGRRMGRDGALSLQETEEACRG